MNVKLEPKPWKIVVRGDERLSVVVVVVGERAVGKWGGVNRDDRSD